MDYRFYLVDTAGHIAAAEELANENFPDAEQMAEALYEACSDTYSGFELWTGTNCVTKREGVPHPTVSAKILSKRRQQAMVDHEENLQRAFAVIARSQKLLERRNSLKLQPTPIDIEPI